MTTRLLRLDDAARRLGMSRRTLDRRVAAGEIMVFRDRRIVGVLESEVERYLRDHLLIRSTRRRAASGRALPPGARLWD